MVRLPRKWLLLLCVLASFACIALGALLWLGRQDDPLYRLTEWTSRGRYHRYDAAIAEVARKYDLDPLLIKAVVWRESEFHPDKRGSKGERGLMQVGEAAAADWARAHKVQTFKPTDLFSPSMNLEVGAWYLKQALQRWASKDDPIPFALAEYNAGKRRVDRWIQTTPHGKDATADEMRAQIDFPSTRAYVDAIVQRRTYYHAHASEP